MINVQSFELETGDAFYFAIGACLSNFCHSFCSPLGTFK